MMSVVALSVTISEVGTICDTVDSFGEDGEDTAAVQRQQQEKIQKMMTIHSIT